MFSKNLTNVEVCKKALKPANICNFHFQFHLQTNDRSWVLKINYSPTPRCTSSKCSLLKMQPPPAINQLWHLPSPQMEQFTNMCTCLCGGRQSELSHPQHGLIPLLMDNQSPQTPCHQNIYKNLTKFPPVTIFFFFK